MNTNDVMDSMRQLSSSSVSQGKMLRWSGPLVCCVCPQFLTWNSMSKLLSSRILCLLSLSTVPCTRDPR